MNNQLSQLNVANSSSQSPALTALELGAIPVINEFVANHVGTDTNEYLEVQGVGNTDYSRYTLLQIEGDSGGGVIDSIFQVGTTDANGYWSTGFLSNQLENGTVSFLLVDNFTGSLGLDLDTNDDGVLDLTPWDSIGDAIAVNDGGSSDRAYADLVLTPNFDGSSFAPGGASRIPGTTNAITWVRNDFDGAGIPALGAGTPTVGEALNTPGAVNELVTVTPPPAALTPIYTIQGAGHTSAFAGQGVETQGIVIAVDSNGFYLQDALGDANLATSDAIFVFTGSVPTIAVGDAVQVSGAVSEFIPGGAATRNLSITQIGGTPTIQVLSSGNALPAATILGGTGRPVPTANIDDDAFASFDPTTDGIDFFESLEGMRVTAQDLLAVTGTNRFGEIFAVVDNGTGATGLSERGTLNLSPNDFNPERIQIDEDAGILPGFSLPQVTVGAELGDVTGVISYDFGNYQIQPTQAFTVVNSTLTPEVSAIQKGTSQLTVASYNVLNLDPVVEDITRVNNNSAAEIDDDLGNGRFGAIATQIVNNLNAPDILGLQEVQDNSGAEINDGVISASQTLQRLVDAIAAAGGPTYNFIDNPFITEGDNGGQPGGNIRTAFLYNPERVNLVENSVKTVDNLAAFAGSRLPLIASFEFQGEAVTVVNNHFSSKGGSAPTFGTQQPFEARQEEPTVNGSLDERQAQSAAVQTFVNGILTTDAAANIVVLGDFNEFEFISPVKDLATNAGLTNLVNTLPEDERYSFIFESNSQSLDHILVSEGLATNAAFDIVHVNTEFADTPQRASDHDPLLASLSFNRQPSPFTLELLHAADQEAAIPAIQDAPRFSAVLNALKNQDLGNDGIADNTLVLSSGDAYIPGLFFSASSEAFGGAGRGDILIQNELGFQAIAFGNHEFDLGTAQVKDLIAGDGAGFTGTAFPYLSSNLDFSTDANLAGLVVADDQAPQPNSIAATTVITVNGEKIGVVGATTPTIKNVNVSISSPGNVTVNPTPFDGVPTPGQLDALAAEIQKDVDELLAANPDLNKVVLLAHMQQIAIEQELASRLKNVDIIVAGGSNTRLLDETDRLRAGDTNQGVYPIVKTDAEGKPIAIVNTDGNYKYVGRLVIDFDANGNIIPESYDATISGAYATDAQGVADLGAEALIDPEIQAIVNTLETIIVAKESNVFGVSNVYLEGTRSSVRVQETNLGNLTADANLAIAKETDPTVLISIKNGGGIRNSIGQLIVPPGGTGAPERLPNEAIPGVKPAGGISETDIANALSFNNGLTLVTVTAAELLAILEHGVAASSPDDANTQGRFPQVAGIQFSFDLTAPAGNRIQSAAVLDDNGNDLDVIIQNGELVGDATRTFRLVTLGFLATGGDGYPFPAREVVNLTQPETAPRTGTATFAVDGSEQDALAEYLADNFGAQTPFNQADTARSLDERLQNLAFRADTVIDAPVVGIDLQGTAGNDPNLTGTAGGDTIAGLGGNDVIRGLGGDDILRGDGNGRGSRSGGQQGGDDIIFGGAGNDRIGGKNGNDQLFGETGDDQIWGDNGDDLLRGGLGNDILTGDDNSGGQGSDTFVLAIGEGTDTITDFEVGIDFIGLSGVGFNELSLNGNSIFAGTEELVILSGVNTSTLTADSFTVV